MTQPLPDHHPLRRLFAGTVHHVLCVDVGMCDPPLADYLVEVLGKFIHMDDLYPFRDAEGRRIERLAEMATDACLEPHVSEQARRRIVHRHIGDFVLFWTGVFPEGLRRLERLGRGDRLTAYLEQGKRSYALASELTTRLDEEPPAGVLRRLSDRFESCVHGLNLCCREWDVLGDQFGSR